MILSENELNSQNLEEFEIFLNIYDKLNAKYIIEIGSLYGWSLQHFIHYGSDDSVVVSIDLPVRDFIGATDFRVTTQESNWKNFWPTWAKNKNSKLFIIPQQSSLNESLQSTTEIFGDNLVDFLFIDGDHRYNAIKTDFNMYSPLVRKGGMVAFHDIGENEEGGGHKFWNEIKNNYKHLEILKDDKREKGIGVLYV